MIAYYIGYRCGWVRVFGWGVRWADRELYPALYSERAGYLPVMRIGVWSIRWLRRS
jgi:hypothetical protein